MTKKLTLTSFLVALSVIFLILSAAVPTGKLALFFLSTISIVLTVITSGVKYAAAAYIATSILCFILYPGNINIIAYVLFFGYYPIAKLYIEKIRKLPVEWILKLVLFNIALLIIPLIIKNIPIYAYAAAEVMFIIYDLLVSYMIGYITHRFAAILNKL